MPTVLRIGALRVAIYPNDHRPAHVHGIGQGCEAVFALNRPPGRVALRENFGFSRRDLAGIERALEEKRTTLARAWEELHGID